jgi:hypothetical protein
MKSKKLLFSSAFMLGGLAIYLTMTSSSNGMNGVTGAANGSGCGGCHGSANTATKITLSGVPASGYMPEYYTT